MDQPRGFSEYNEPSQQRFDQPKNNGKAIAAMVLGILSLVIPYVGLIIGIIAIVFASLSMKEIKRTGEQGRGMAVAGLVCGIIGTALYTIILLVLVVVGITLSQSSYTTF